MIPAWIIGVVVALCLVSSLLFYMFLYQQQKRRRSSFSLLPPGESRRLTYSVRPSIDIVAKRLSNEMYPLQRTSLFSCTNNTVQEENEVDHRTQSSNTLTESQRQAAPVISPQTFRSASLAGQKLPVRRPRSNNWRQGSIVDTEQIAKIKFVLPPTKEKYRRRSVAVCSNVVQHHPQTGTARNVTMTADENDDVLYPLLTFRLAHLTSAQLQVHFISIKTHIPVQQLTLKVKLIPDGKERYVHIKKPILPNEPIEQSIAFPGVTSEKLSDKSLLITITGKKQGRRSVHLGQIGKILLGELHLADGKQVTLIHEIEKKKMSSIEALIALVNKNNRYLTVDLERIKGLKVDQKNPDNKCYLRVILLDRHCPLSTRQTKTHKISSPTVTICEQLDFALFNLQINRLILYIQLFINEKCVAKVKLASPLYTSGSGSVHWQQLQARQSFSMWHSLVKHQDEG